VTIVEFLDPECESCRAAFPVVKELLDEYPDDVRLVVRYFPLHGNSVLAAQATEAAGEQGKYAEMQATLFERQPEWGEKQESQEDLFVEYARELGLDIDEFTAALDNPEYREKVERDRADGVALGVTGTPTFFVNGQWIPQPSYNALKSAIDEALE
jgi:protein-disulfide isomerase